MTLKNIFFDFDGTLANSELGIRKSVDFALQEVGLSKLQTRDQYKAFIGPPFLSGLDKFYPSIPTDIRISADLLYHDFYFNHEIYELEFYPKILEEIQKLRIHHYDLYIASAKANNALNKILEHFNLAEYFIAIFGNDYPKRRLATKADIIREAISEMHLNAHECLMVGDRLSDIEGGKKNSVFTMAVTYGFGSIDELKNSQADVCVRNPNNIYEEITSFNCLLRGN
ncbi:HAD hydrolase-like protein [Oenococcus sp.]|uniref:HAD hydrolase-like protein n=1 Tax=Oenococcus sp. TaxID=1979414 RepID=UPI0039E7F3A5